jgi:hypothetical protein
MSKQKVICFIFTKLSDIITNSKLRHRRILCLRFQGFVLFFPPSFLPSQTFIASGDLLPQDQGEEKQER